MRGGSLLEMRFIQDIIVDTTDYLKQSNESLENSTTYCANLLLERHCSAFKRLLKTSGRLNFLRVLSVVYNMCLSFS